MPEPETAAQRFAQLYAGLPPWEIGQMQPSILPFLNSDIRGPILDVGCGSGAVAIDLARRGYAVTAIDLVPEAIRRARQNLAETIHDAGSDPVKMSLTFEVQDALQLGAWPPGGFQTIIDLAVFHTFPVERRPQYVAALTHVAAIGAKLCITCFSEREPGTHGPLRTGAVELLAAFGIKESQPAQWRLLSLQATRYVLRADANPPFSAGGAHAWQMILERI